MLTGVYEGPAITNKELKGYAAVCADHVRTCNNCLTVIRGYEASFYEIPNCSEDLKRLMKDATAVFDILKVTILEEREITIKAMNSALELDVLPEETQKTLDVFQKTFKPTEQRFLTLIEEETIKLAPVKDHVDKVREEEYLNWIETRKQDKSTNNNN